MSWKSGRSFLKTTVFRLTVWYLGVFAVLTVAVFLVVYLFLALHLGEMKDAELLDKAREFQVLYREHGRDALQAEYEREAETHDTGRVFFRLVSAQGTLLASSDLGRWKGLAAAAPLGAPFPGDRPRFSTFSLRGMPFPARLFSVPVGGGGRIDVGGSLEREELILKRYREIFGAALLVMIGCGGLFGFLLARKAMAGVQRVTDTATGIGRRDLGRRVPLADEGEEINALARAFNGMLERVENLVGEVRQVTDNVAHELRTPVTRIRGMAETTLKGDDDLGEYREMAVSVIGACDDLVEMIGTLLEIAKTDSGTVGLDLAPLDLHGLVVEAVDLFAPMAEDNGVSLRLSGSGEPAEVVGDRRRLQRAVANLLDNAIKYTPAGGDVTAVVEAGVAEVRVAISDTGIGIGAGDLPHVVERFYRCDPSRSSSGTGLGLSLAQAILRAHGGGITAQSSPRGSTFSFSLPAFPSPGPALS